MAKQITMWEDNQGGLHKSAIEAANADAEFELKQAISVLAEDIISINMTAEELTQELYENREYLRKILGDTK
jgi:hypothetical protein